MSVVIRCWWSPAWRSLAYFLDGCWTTRSSAWDLPVRGVCVWNTIVAVFDKFNGACIARVVSLKSSCYRRSCISRSLSVVFVNSQSPSTCPAWNLKYPHRILQCFHLPQIVLLVGLVLQRKEFSTLLALWNVPLGVPHRPWLQIWQDVLVIPWGSTWHRPYERCRHRTLPCNLSRRQ